MGTSNFNYENRCVFISDDDYEFNNYPKNREYRRDSLRSYPSYTLLDYDFKFFEIVMTAGYYEGGCIDYIAKDIEIDMKDDCGYWFLVSIEDLKPKTQKKIQRKKLFEERLVNKTIDKIKHEHGYTEYTQFARFSNGETLYKEIA